MTKFRKRKTAEATIFGVIMLVLAVIYGRYIPGSAVASWFTFDHHSLTIILALYGFLASVLPVWLLLAPRDYLSAIMKISVVAMLAVGVIVVAPELKMPAVTVFAHGGGPNHPGNTVPLSVHNNCLRCHFGLSLAGEFRNNSKDADERKDIKFIAVGSMLIEGLVSILALIAAASLLPLDYFMINVSPEKLQHILPQLQAMGFTDSNIQVLSQEVGEKIIGRTGGAVSLAVGMAQIFSSIPGMDQLMSYWYHFAIMFEALFILTTIDAGTRIARFVLQEAAGKVYKPFSRTTWLPGNLLASGLVVFAWAYFIYSGTVATIWPMFGSANQLLATIALAIGTSYIINRGKIKYAWITVIPMIFVGVTTLTAGWQNIRNIYLPQAIEAETRVTGIINMTLTTVIVICVFIILLDAIPKWVKAWQGKLPVDRLVR